MSRAGVAGVTLLLLMSPASRAADWNGSYSADDRCYCSGTVDARLASRIVPTPRGGQSIARVCARIGSGPGLSFSDGRFDRVVYEDVQCGHGPFATGEEAPAPDCAGSLAPGGDECLPVGPRWDLTTAYARPARAASVEAASAIVDAGVMGAPAAPVMAAAASAPAAAAARPEGRVVEIGGRRWREAPLGTPENGPPGTRIILDGRVYLDIEKASAEDFLPRADAPRPAAAAPAPVPAVAPAPRRTAPKRAAVAAPAESASASELDTAPRATRGTSAVELRARRERQIARAREREARSARAARAAEAKAGAEAAAAAARPDVDASSADVMTARSGRTDEPVAASATPAERPSMDAAATNTRSTDTAATAKPETGTDERLLSAPGPAPVVVTPVPLRVDAPAESAEPARKTRRAAADEVADEVASSDAEESPVASTSMRALRMPPATRASSREFGYVDALPTSYAYGGGGVMLEGSAAFGGRFRALARIGAASEYQEALIGGSWFVTPPDADRLTVVLTTGVETGRFALEGSGVSTELSDTGLYLGAASRFVVNDRFELQAGVGYSSFFEGDPIAFGGGYYHVAPRLDVVSRVEVGDNDSLGIGVRYYY